MRIKIIHKISNLISWLFPERCFGCRKHEKLICESCLSGLSLPSVTRSKYISIIFSAAKYDDFALKSAIKTMKYRSGSKIAGILGNFLAQELNINMNQILKEKPVVLAIPMNARRIRERGYNHAEFLAETIAKELSLPHTAFALKKIKNTYPQAECRSRNERFENIRDSFGINPAVDISGNNILLVDDVSTTGATLNEAAKVLKKSGAQKIFAAVVARR